MYDTLMSRVYKFDKILAHLCDVLIKNSLNPNRYRWKNKIYIDRIFNI